VPEPEYRQGRRRVLESFLSRPRIYHFLGQLEEPARRNLEAEISRLASQLIAWGKYDYFPLFGAGHSG
jgi:predicted metal-dependent HD superfamily phosphohydrolase